jgi:hypothetical protein
MLDARLPSSASFAVPLNITVVPPTTLAPLAGAVMLSAGGVFALATML